LNELTKLAFDLGHHMSISVLVLQCLLFSILVSPSEHGGSSLWCEKTSKYGGNSGGLAALSLSEPNRPVLSDRKEGLIPSYPRRPPSRRMKDD
jgi:hypothetical protein